MVGPGGHGPAGKSAAVPGGRLRRAPVGDGGVGHAQTARALVSNIEQRNSGGSKSTLLDLAQAFTTGANDTGYTLTGIDMFLYGRHASQTPPTMTLRSGSATGTKVADFTGPSSIGRGDKTYASTPTTTVTLSASTEYWVVAKGATSYWNDTLLEAEDSGGAPGWTIADVGQSRLTDDGPFFDKYTTAFQFRINGTVNPLVLASNVGQALNDYGSLGSTSDQAQNFTTGDNAAGYTLTGIDLSLRSENTGAVPPTVTLHSGSATGTKVADLTGPPALTAGMTDTYTFTPATTVTLGASTGYWVVAEGGSDDIDWTRTASNAEDATPASGWGIEDGSGSRGAAETGNFTASTKSLRLRVKGIPLNNSPAGAPAITAPNVFRVPAVLSVDLSGITDGNGVLGIADTAEYRWQRFAAGGTMPEADSIGTDATYTLTRADAGKRLKVEVRFIDDDGYSEGARSSAATPAVTAAASCTPPTLAGGATQIGPARKVGVGGDGTSYGFIESLIGSLDNATFTTAASSDYEIKAIVTGNNLFAIRFDPNLSAADQRTLVVHFCDQPYAFGSTTLQTNQYPFSTPSQDWSTHAERTVYRARTPPARRSTRPR